MNELANRMFSEACKVDMRWICRQRAAAFFAQTSPFSDAFGSGCEKTLLPREEIP